MAYITPTELLLRFDAEEMAQRADRGVPRRVSRDMMVAMAAGADVSGWPVEGIASTTAALAVIQRSIDDAVSVIDGYLAARYQVPLSPAPASVSRYASDIARYYLYDDAATETVQKRHDDAIAFFRAVAAGKASLGPDAETPAPAASGGGSVQMVSSPSVFGRGVRGL